MKKKQRYNQKQVFSPQQVEQLLEQVMALAVEAAGEQFYVVDVAWEEEGSRWFLRVYIETTKPEARLSLDECQRFSRLMDPLLDERVSMLLDVAYNFEVSSPGLFRALKTQRELKFYQGKPVSAVLKTQKLPIKGTLQSFNEQDNTLVLESQGQAVVIPWNPKQVKLTLDPPIRSLQNLEESSIIGETTPL